jgi:hypothetical protein
MDYRDDRLRSARAQKVLACPDNEEKDSESVMKERAVAKVRGCGFRLVHKVVKGQEIIDTASPFFH